MEIKSHRRHAWPIGDERRGVHQRVQETHGDCFRQKRRKSNASATEHEDQPSIFLRSTREIDQRRDRKGKGRRQACIHR